jgi:hypothetical protein
MSLELILVCVYSLALSSLTIGFITGTSGLLGVSLGLSIVSIGIVASIERRT